MSDATRVAGADTLLPQPASEAGAHMTRKPPRRTTKRDVHGWIVLDKPIGMTSTHAGSIIKRLCAAKRVGHAGTLDPLASGCLPIALGEAQDRAVRVRQPKDLSVFTIRWGEERDTDDAEGRVVANERIAPRPGRHPRAVAALHRHRRASTPALFGCENRGRTGLRSGPRGRNGRVGSPAWSRFTGSNSSKRPIPITPC